MMQKKYLFIFFSMMAIHRLTALPLFPHYDLNAFGNEPASEWYQQKTKEFLEYLKVDYTVPVYKLTNSTYKKTLGLTTSTGIWFNEPLLEKTHKSLQLFTIAHEAAHYALKHPQRKLTQHFLIIMAGLGIFYTVDSFDEPLFVAHHHSLWRFFCQLPKRLSLGMLIYHYWFKTLSNQISIPIEREADLKAVRILYKNGYQQVILDHLHFLEHLIKNGKNHQTQDTHPCVEEEYHYIKNCLLFLQRKTSTSLQTNNS